MHYFSFVWNKHKKIITQHLPAYYFIEQENQQTKFIIYDEKNFARLSATCCYINDKAVYSIEYSELPLYPKNSDFFPTTESLLAAHFPEGYTFVSNPCAKERIVNLSKSWIQQAIHSNPDEIEKDRDYDHVLRKGTQFGNAFEELDFDYAHIDVTKFI